MPNNAVKELYWIGSSIKDLRAFPTEVKEEFGYALFQVQQGKTPRGAKPLKGYGGATVLELRTDFETDTYRAVYTVRFAEAVYVLHAFQKKSKQGIATPQSALDLIKRRLRQAQQDYEARQQKQEDS